MKKTPINDAAIRDGIESLPEREDLAAEVPAKPPEKSLNYDNADLDEALMETFPASDPIASGRFE